MSATSKSVTRRDLLAGAVTASLGSVALSGCKASQDGGWDHVAEVIVVGSGVGACTAALTAHHNGHSVLLLEKADELGGTSAKSAGVLWVPNNFSLKEKGIADSRDDCLRYMARFSFPERYNPEVENYGLARDELDLLAAFYDNAAPATEVLGELGALNVAEWRMFHLDRPATDYLDNVPENKVPAGRALGPVNADGQMGLGDELMRQLIAAIRQREIDTYVGHRVARVVQDDAGRVVGVEVETVAGSVTFQATQAVIFAAGGYAHSAELVRRHQSNYLYGSCAKPASTGDFIAIAAAAGAAMGDLSGAWRTQIVLDEALVSRYLAQGVFYPPGDSMIQVNKYGRRVVDENRNYNDRTEVHGLYDATRAEYPNQLMLMIYDQRSAEAFAGVYPLPETPADGVHVVTGNSIGALTQALETKLAEMAGQTGGFTLHADFARNLQAEIARYNAFAMAGRDEDFGRGAAAYDSEWFQVFSPQRSDSVWSENPYPSISMHPLRDDGPYFAIVLAAGALDTNGGPLIDASARVLDAHGQPIPGLYGAGNCIASPSRDAYYGAGHTLGMAMTFGFIAANSVAADSRDSTGQR